MEDYYVKGFMPPPGVNNASAVKRIQKLLKVKTDGIWGAQTQAAWDDQGFVRNWPNEPPAKTESTPDYALPGYTPPKGVTSKYNVKRVQANLGIKQDGIWCPQSQEAWEKEYGNLWQSHLDNAPKADSRKQLTDSDVSFSKAAEKAYGAPVQSPLINMPKLESIKPLTDRDLFSDKAAERPYAPPDMNARAYAAWLSKASLAEVDEYYEKRLRELYDRDTPYRRFAMDGIIMPGISLKKETALHKLEERLIVREREAAVQAVRQRLETLFPSASSGTSGGVFFDDLTDLETHPWYTGNSPQQTPSPTAKPSPASEFIAPPGFEIPKPPDKDKRKSNGTSLWDGKAGENLWNKLWNKARVELLRYKEEGDDPITKEQRKNIILNAVNFIRSDCTYGSYNKKAKKHYTIDCSGLVKELYGEAGISVFNGKNSEGIKEVADKNGWYTDKNNIDTSALRPGDIVVWEKGGTVSHVGIYLCTVGDQRWIIESTGTENGPNVSEEWNQPSKSYLVSGYITPKTSKKDSAPSMQVPQILKGESLGGGTKAQNRTRAMIE